MPRFSQYAFDHRIDNQIIEREALRFDDQEAAEDFATVQYLADAIPRSVILGVSGLYFILENTSHEVHPNEVFYINSIPGDGE